MSDRKYHEKIFTPAQRRVFAATTAAAARWDAYLAGGAAVALYFGHRRSEDFDWFTPSNIPTERIVADLEGLGVRFEVDQNTEGTFLGRVDGVKFSVFRYRYPALASAEAFKGCALASLPDLAAMKLAALCGRATKKDYVDVHALITIGGMSVREMLSAFVAKFPTAEPVAALRAIGHFADVDKQAMPPMLNKTTWKQIKSALAKAASSVDVAALRAMTPP